MKATQLLHNLGQSLCLDNDTQDLINTSSAKLVVNSYTEFMRIIASKIAKLTKAV